jgi:hypothetical protein
MAKPKSSKKSYPVIGGPLDGVKMTSDELARGHGTPGNEYYQAPGRFAELADEYLAFNCGSNYGRARGGRVWSTTEKKWVASPVSSMVWLHISLFERPMTKPEDVLLGGSPLPPLERSGEEVRFELVLMNITDETETLVEQTLTQLGADGLLAKPEQGGLHFVFALATDDRDAALVEVTTTLIAAGVPPFLSLTCEPSVDSVLMPLEVE